MPDMLKPRPCINRLHSEGFAVSEYALRQWIRSGAIPARKVENSYLLYYPNVLAFIQCANGQDNPAPATSSENRFGRC